MANIQIMTDPARKEDVFSTPPMPEEYPFWVTQYGHTYADRNYSEATFNTKIARVEYIISGKGIINSKNISCIAKAGDTYILHQGDTHNYYSDAREPMDKIWFNLTGPLAQDIIRIYKLSDTILFPGVDSSEWIKKIHDICRNNTDPYVIQQKTSGVFCEFINFLYRQYSGIQSSQDFLDDLRSYLDLHIHENVSIEDLCRISNKSPNHTIRLFKQRFGTTPYQYVLMLKLRFARTLLRSGNMSVEKIAEQLNFCNAGHFSTVFYKHVGMRPSEYRKEMHKLVPQMPEKGREDPWGNDDEGVYHPDVPPTKSE